MNLLHTDIMKLIINNVLIIDLRDLQAFAVNHKIHALAETIWLQLAHSSLRCEPSTWTVADIIAMMHPTAIIQYLKNGGKDLQMCLNIDISDDPLHRRGVPFVLRVGVLARCTMYIDTRHYSIEYILVDGKYVIDRFLYRYPVAGSYADSNTDTGIPSPRSLKLRADLATLVRKIFPAIDAYTPDIQLAPEHLGLT